MVHLVGLDPLNKKIKKSRYCKTVTDRWGICIWRERERGKEGAVERERLVMVKRFADLDPIGKWVWKVEEEEIPDGGYSFV